MSTPDDGAGAAQPRQPERTGRDLWLPVAIFVAVAYGSSWLIALPLYTSGQGLAHGFLTPILVAMMTTPMIAAVVVSLWVQKIPLKDAWARLGILVRPPYKRFFFWFVLAWLGMILLVVAALGTSALCGVYRFDLAELSGLREIVLAEALITGQDTSQMATMHEILFAQVISVIFFSLLNILPALGEEIGWRGWLMPQLATLGTAPTILISGVLWGLWHLPLLLLGYNYPGATPLAAAGAMVGMCTLIGALLYWVRLRSGSVWPAAVGHGALNASAGLALVLAHTPVAAIDTTRATILGVCGWIVPALLVAVIWWRGEFRAPTRAIAHT